MHNCSFEDSVRDLEAALELARDAAPDSLAARLRGELEHQLAGIVAGRLRLQRTRRDAQRATRLKNQALEAGRLAASRLRHCIRAVLGPRDPRLKEFGIAPLRRRNRARVGFDGGPWPSSDLSRR